MGSFIQGMKATEQYSQIALFVRLYNCKVLLTFTSKDESRLLCETNMKATV